MKYKMGSLRYLGIKTTQVQALFCNPQTVVAFGFRRCSCCGEIKPFYGFGIYRSKMGKRNIRTYCKRCSMNMRNEWAAKNRDKTKAYMEKYKPNILRKHKEAQLVKRSENTCVICGKPLLDKILNAKYCNECKALKRREWKKKDYEDNIDTYRKYYENNKLIINNKNRIREQRRRQYLTDRYIKKLLREKSGFTAEQIKQYPNLIEVKRLIIKTKRL